MNASLIKAWIIMKMTDFDQIPGTNDRNDNLT